MLRSVLDEWEEDRHFAAFMGSFRFEVDELKRQYSRLVPKAKMALDMAKENGGSDGPGTRHIQAVKAYLGDFQQQSANCTQAMITLMSRALLKCDITQKARAAHLRSIGFSVRSMDDHLALDELLVVGLAAWMILLFCFVCIPGVRSSMSMEETLARTLMIAVIYSVAVACAVYERSRRPGRPARERMRPVGNYLAVGLVASACGLLISLWFHTLIFRSLPRSIARIGVVHPWFVLTFLTAFMTAFCLDNDRVRASRLQLRAMESGAMATVMLIGAYLVRALLLERTTGIANHGGTKSRLSPAS